MFKISIAGLDTLKSKLDAYSKKAEANTQKQMDLFATNILMSAKAKADFEISGELKKTPIVNGYTITTDTKFSAYVEFGTGIFAKDLLGNYPSEWVQMARQFYVNGLGRTPSMPYLYPAYNTEKLNFINELKRSFEQL